MHRFQSLALTLALAALIVGCGGEDRGPGDAREGDAAGPTLTEFQLEHGIGPIDSEVALGELDPRWPTGDRSFSSSTVRPAT
jgi:hypothetical protein